MRKIVFAACVLLVSACSLAPKFETPKTELPAAFKEEGADKTAKWTAAATPPTAQRGQWWTIFGDTALNALEEQAAAGSQTLKIAAARVTEARALAGAAKADILPNLTLGANAVRTNPGSVPFPSSTYNAYTAAAVATWEPDFFGRLRDAEKSLRFSAEAQQAAYNDALLSLQADVAQSYFAIRALDSERVLLRDTIEVYEKSAHIMGQRYKVGETGEQDQARAQGELNGARAELTALDRRRATIEHTLAVLLGQIPSTYSFAEAPLKDVPPRMPAGLSSTLLTRRPDVASALDLMAAANADIGAARAAFFPDLSLTASGGFQAASLGDLFKWSAHTWALGQVAGLALSLPVFDNGRRSARVDAARARYDGALANYRQQVLVAFRDVEDNLSDQKLLMTQAEQQDSAAASASRATELSRKRYDAGDVDYSEVVDAERISLAAERAAVQTRGQRFITGVTLVRALGGGWE